MKPNYCICNVVEEKSNPPKKTSKHTHTHQPVKHTLTSRATLLLVAAVLAVVIPVAAEGRGDALTVPTLQQTLALTR